MGMHFDVKKRIWDYAHSEKIDQEEHGFSFEAEFFPFSSLDLIKNREGSDESYVERVGVIK